MTSLYICYQGLLEPLIQTQVMPYLEGLARAGYRMVLLTFEPRPPSDAEAASWHDKLRERGIIWHWRRYHKWPSGPATTYDVLAGILTGFRLARRYRVRLLHARVHVPGLMALVLKWLTGAKLLFDIRGFMAKEYVDAGIWKAGGNLYRMLAGSCWYAADPLHALRSGMRSFLWHPGILAQLLAWPMCRLRPAAWHE